MKHGDQAGPCWFCGGWVKRPKFLPQSPASGYRTEAFCPDCYKAARAIILRHQELEKRLMAAQSRIWERERKKRLGERPEPEERTWGIGG